MEPLPGSSSATTTDHRRPSNRARDWTRRCLRSALAMAWLPQAQRLRIRVAAHRRARVRAAIRQADALLHDPRNAEPDVPPQIGPQGALRALLAAVARAEGDDDLTEDEAVRRGAARVASTLTDASLAETLARAGGDPGDATSSDPAAPLPTAARLRLLYDWTRGLLDVRSDREVRFVRRARWGAGAVAVACAILALVADKNLARGKPVTASSICPSSPVPRWGKDRLSRLVDGDRLERAIPYQQWAHGTYAACTQLQEHPWFTVDLGAEHTINRVVVYNRSDCCWGTDDLPLSIQLSSDNKTFETVATRWEPFTEDFPWRRAINHRRARYVRLYNPSDLKKGMALNEIEIYGR